MNEFGDNESPMKTKEKRRRKLKSARKRALKQKRLSLNLRKDLPRSLKSRQRLSQQNKQSSLREAEAPGNDFRSQALMQDG